MIQNYSTPKRSFIGGVNDLRQCLAYGLKGRLIRAKNEDCNFPITEKNKNNNFRCYNLSHSVPSTYNEILNNKNYNEFEKHLSLNYIHNYGTKEAVEAYYKDGILTKDNFLGVGVSHLVNVDDAIKFFISINDEWADNLTLIYRTPSTRDERHWFSFFQLKNGYHKYNIKHFKHKVWIVEMLNEKQSVELPVLHSVLIKILNTVLYPLKYIPTKRVLRMDKYTQYAFRIGSVFNGYEIQFQIPKKFSFKD
jgi:hypothetical protein